MTSINIFYSLHRVCYFLLRYCKNFQLECCLLTEEQEYRGEVKKVGVQMEILNSFSL